MFNQVFILICTLLCLVFTGWVMYSCHNLTFEAFKACLLAHTVKIFPEFFCYYIEGETIWCTLIEPERAYIFVKCCISCVVSGTQCCTGLLKLLTFDNMDLKSSPRIWTINEEGRCSCKVSPLWWWRGDDIMPLYLGTILLQSLRDPASGTSWKTTFPVWLLLLLHRHLLHCWLWGRHTPNLALPAASGHSHLCCLGGASTAGKLSTFGGWLCGFIFKCQWHFTTSFTGLSAISTQ